MNGIVEVALRRTGNRGRTTVDRLERFQAEFSVTDGAFSLAWTASNGQRNDLSCPLTPSLLEALGSPKGDGTGPAEEGK